MHVIEQICVFSSMTTYIVNDFGLIVYASMSGIAFIC